MTLSIEEQNSITYNNNENKNNENKNNENKNNENDIILNLSFSELYKRRKEDFIKKTTKLKKYVKEN